jgi:acyl carrier protein
MEHELASLIVSSLALDGPLFGDGLGLDSIDALEISLEIAKKYGVEIKAEDERNQQIFSSLRSLATFVGQHTTK